MIITKHSKNAIKTLLISLGLLATYPFVYANTQHSEPIDWSAPHIPEIPKNHPG